MQVSGSLRSCGMEKSNEKVFKSTCSYCGVGCGVEISKDRRGRLHLKGDEAHPVNKGMLCSKGMNLHYTVMDQSDRLMRPKMRWSKNHPHKEVTWDTAMERAASVFKTFIEKYGPDSVGFYVSGQCLTEEYYLVNKLTKGFIGTNNIDTKDADNNNLTNWQPADLTLPMWMVQPPEKDALANTEKE